MSDTVITEETFFFVSVHVETIRNMRGGRAFSSLISIGDTAEENTEIVDHVCLPTSRLCMPISLC